MAHRLFPWTIEEHASRLEGIGMTLRSTEIARRAITVRRGHPQWEDLPQGERHQHMIAQMGRTNAPYWVASTPLEDLEALLGVMWDPKGRVFRPRPEGPRVTDTTESLVAVGRILSVLPEPMRDMVVGGGRSTSKQARAEAGLPTGRLPFGYRWSDEPREVTVGGERRMERVPEPDPNTAWVVRRIFDAFREGARYHEIARELNAGQAPSPGGQGWNKDSVREVITNPFYAGRILWQPVQVDARGHRRYSRHRGVLYAGLHEGIVSLEEWDAIQKERMQRARAARHLAKRVKVPRYDVRPPRPGVRLFVAGEIEAEVSG